MSFLREIEKKWQELWKRDRVFEADPRKQKKFYITIPYPYTSGAMHVGHGRTYTLGDIIARFYRMLGYNVLFPMAAHVSGTPISSISARIARGEEEAIELYKDTVSIYESDEKKVEEIVMGFKEPEQIANYFSDKVKEDLSTLGCSIDWRRFFRTNEPYYNKFVEWQFKKLNAQGFIKKGNYPILYCLRCENAVGEDDIKGGDEIKAGILELQLIKFPYEDAFLVASTLRAETIFGVTNLWINPKDRLVKILIQGEKWVISKQTLTKLRLQGINFEVLEEMDGIQLIGKRVKNPINSKELLVLPASFVDPEFGTGVVYSVPSHAPYDYIALEDIKKKGASEFGISQAELSSIQPISIIATPGYGDHPAIELCKKLQVRDQNDREKLDQATQLLYREEFYEGVLKPNCMEFSGMKVSEA
ncbi:MAG: class I tRNA ligase family protein, partial [Candidatus Nanoarchaeia archaeon]|nr:class I tRNA ligase family protein [Candidatus Haiyanarchaeum thermophilum]